MLLNLWQSIVGEAPQYLSGSSYNSWDYGAMIEYGFVCISALLIITVVFKLLFIIINSFRR